MSIANSSDILQAFFEATPDAIFVKDLEGRYVLVNDAAARFLGRTPAEILGKRDGELYPEDTARQFVRFGRRRFVRRRWRWRRGWRALASA